MFELNGVTILLAVVAFFLAMVVISFSISKFYHTQRAAMRRDKEELIARFGPVALVVNRLNQDLVYRVIKAGEVKVVQLVWNTHEPVSNEKYITAPSTEFLEFDVKDFLERYPRDPKDKRGQRW